MDYNPLDPDVIQDPYPFYTSLRRDAPLYTTPQGYRAVSRYEDVLAVLQEPGRFSSSAMADLINGLKAVALDEEAQGGETLLGNDPPVHSRLRKIVNRAFTASRVAALEPRIRSIASELLSSFPPGSEFDLVRDFAVPLPVMVIAEILGIDPSRRDDFKRWSEEQMAATAGPPSPQLRAALARSGRERSEYISEVLEVRRREPRDDAISALVQAERDEEAMTDHEITNFIVLLLIAGNETTTNLIGNTVLALAEHPDVHAKVRQELSRVPALLEETLRYDSPVQLTLRRATADAEIAGEKLHRGETIALLLGSANRDERYFEAPDAFEPSREQRRHLSFGFGTHFCLGAGLARLEGRIAFEALLTRFRGFAISEAERTPSLITRGASSLRVQTE